MVDSSVEVKQVVRDRLNCGLHHPELAGDNEINKDHDEHLLVKEYPLAAFDDFGAFIDFFDLGGVSDFF